jgi:adhesin HecA-like repeat protein
MPEFAKKDVAETEKGFGTGLRAQLERRRETTGPTNEDASTPDKSPKSAPSSVTADAAPKAKSEPKVEAEHLGDENATLDDAELEALRAELAASLAREQDLRGALNEQVQAYERELDAEQDFALRAAELDQRAGKLSAHEAALEERERQLAEQRELLDADAARVAEQQNELAALDARTAEQQRNVQAKLRELTAADQERAKATSELSKQAASIAAREKKLSRTEVAVETRERDHGARADAREATLTERESTL